MEEHETLRVKGHETLRVKGHETLRVKGIVVFQDLMRVENKNEENRNANYVQKKAKSGKVGILLILRSVTSETIIC